jgi:hypothetical protein
VGGLKGNIDRKPWVLTSKLHGFSGFNVPIQSWEMGIYVPWVYEFQIVTLVFSKFTAFHERLLVVN